MQRMRTQVDKSHTQSSAIRPRHPKVVIFAQRAPYSSRKTLFPGSCSPRENHRRAVVPKLFPLLGQPVSSHQRQLLSVPLFMFTIVMTAAAVR
jgi:hypothetical protein